MFRKYLHFVHRSIHNVYMKTTTVTYWANPNGAVICSEHAANYLRSALKAHPKRMEHKTPLGTYEIMHDEEIQWLEEEFGYSCEVCKRVDNNNAI